MATVAMMNSAMKAAGQREATEGVSSPAVPDSNQRRSVSTEKEMESTPDVSVPSNFLTLFRPMEFPLSLIQLHQAGPLYIQRCQPFQFLRNYNVVKYAAFRIIIPPANFVCRGYTVFTLSVRPCVRLSVRPSVRNALFL